MPLPAMAKRTGSKIILMTSSFTSSLKFQEILIAVFADYDLSPPFF